VWLWLPQFRQPTPPDLVGGHVASTTTIYGEEPKEIVEIAFLVSLITKLMASFTIDNEKSRYKERLSLTQNS
jgi:hypothetical protein